MRFLLAVSPTSVGTLEDGPGRDCLNVTFFFLFFGLTGPITLYMLLLVSTLTQINMYILEFTSLEGFLLFFIIRAPTNPHIRGGVF